MPRVGPMPTRDRSGSGLRRAQIVSGLFRKMNTASRSSRTPYHDGRGLRPVSQSRCKAAHWCQDGLLGHRQGAHARTGAVCAPGAQGSGTSGLAGNVICDTRHHGGDDQAVYAYAREDLDWWQDELGEPLRPGMFGDNLTTTGLDVSGARIGERWRVGTPGPQGHEPSYPSA